MAYSADTLAYDVITEMAQRELTGPVWILGVKYILPRGIDPCSVASLFSTGLLVALAAVMEGLIVYRKGKSHW